MKLRELETLRSFREMQDTVTELNQRWQVTHANHYTLQMVRLCSGRRVTQAHSVFLQHHMSRGSSTGGGGGHWKESPKKNAMNELQDKLMTVRLREAQAQAELREVKLKALQLESQVRMTHCTATQCQPVIDAIKTVKSFSYNHRYMVQKGGSLQLVTNFLSEQCK